MKIKAGRVYGTWRADRLDKSTPEVRISRRYWFATCTKCKAHHRVRADKIATSGCRRCMGYLSWDANGIREPKRRAKEAASQRVSPVINPNHNGTAGAERLANFDVGLIRLKKRNGKTEAAEVMAHGAEKTRAYLESRARDRNKADDGWYWSVEGRKAIRAIIDEIRAYEIQGAE